jgi:hypothetical protein
MQIGTRFRIIQVSQNWRTNYLLPYRGCLNVHEKNMEKMFPTKRSIILKYMYEIVMTAMSNHAYYHKVQDHSLSISNPA